MGLYIEPNTDKLNWCQANGELLTESMGFSNIDYSSINKDNKIVCLVDNGMFYAGAVAFSEREFEVFNNPDGRNKYWFSIPNSKLKEVCPSWDDYVKD